MNFCSRSTINGQVLADFIDEFTYTNTVEVTGMVDITEAAKVVEAQGEKNSVLMKRDAEQWMLTSNDTRSGADIMLISPEGHKIHCALCFRFKGSNNKAK